MLGYALLVVLGLLVLAVVTAVALNVVGSIRWRGVTADRNRRLAQAAPAPDAGPAAAPGPSAGAPAEDLPEPVRRYLQLVLPPEHAGSPPPARVTMVHHGTFNMSETEENWQPFTARQYVTPKRPGFLWDARMGMGPGISARVHDAYIAGEGLLHVTLFGLFTVARMQDRVEMARGELLRFLAEAPWYPQILGSGRPNLRWEPRDAQSARVLLSDGEVEAAMTFFFGEDGLIARVHADARGRTVAGTIVQTPWEGSWWDYRRFAGVLVPTEGEVRWLTASGEHPYWRGSVSSIRFG